VGLGGPAERIAVMVAADSGDAIAILEKVVAAPFPVLWARPDPSASRPRI